MRKKIISFAIGLVLISAGLYAAIQVYEFYNIDVTTQTITISSSTPSEVNTLLTVMDNRLSFWMQNIDASNKIWCKTNAADTAINDGFVLLPYGSQFLPISVKKSSGVNMTLYCLAENADSKLTVVQAR